MRYFIVFVWDKADANCAAFFAIGKRYVPKLWHCQGARALRQIAFQCRRAIQDSAVGFPKLKIIRMIFAAERRHVLAGGIEFEAGWALLGHVRQRIDVSDVGVIEFPDEPVPHCQISRGAAAKPKHTAKSGERESKTPLNGTHFRALSKT